MSRKRELKSADENMVDVLFIRMTKGDRQLVKEASKRKGLSASAFARMAILDRVQQELQDRRRSATPSPAR